MFKDISYLKLWWTTCFEEGNHLCNFGGGHYEKHFCKIIVQEEMTFKDISYLQLCWLIGSEEGNHLCNFGRGH